MKRIFHLIKGFFRRINRLYHFFVHLIFDTSNEFLNPDLQDAIRENLLYLRFAPPGHYYSPIPSISQLKAKEKKIFEEKKPLPKGIKLNSHIMLDYLKQFQAFYPEFNFSEQKSSSSYRFWMDNGIYSRGDAIVLYSMMRHLKPSKIIEAGSGMSSCLMLDVNEFFLDNRVQLTFVDPYPDRLLSLIHPGDETKIQLVSENLQDTDLSIYAELEENDIAFFDSTHVSKCDSDVNFIFFEILPILKPGVYIHFHDIFYPFEYPKQWLLEIGAAWNEIYLLRAFLEFNDLFEISFFSDYMTTFHRGQLEDAIPRFLDGPGGSIWLKKISD
ncbi:MAG: class I SAM-dependent methyltransferase [Anaerolineales bacterium]|nr:class I SAM-dependent methyltransferase [Anaerolineales bacterium]